MENVKYQNQKEILIAGLTPPLLEKSVVWFEENRAKILKLGAENPFWQKQILVLKTGQTLPPDEFIGRLIEMGYEKLAATDHLRPGAFARRGGLIDVFPVNLLQGLKVEFFGNSVENIIFFGEIIDEKKRKESLAKLLKSRERILKSFAINEYVVHDDHGIGIFRGEAEIPGSKGEREKMLVVEYAAPRNGAEPDRLYIPLQQIRKLDHYIGFTTPPLHRLGSEVWRLQKKKIREEVLKMARELLLLYASRSRVKRAPFFGDKDLEKSFESGFEHVETGDQERAWLDVKNDLEKPEPLERLVVGDVGFGKTEIALRGAFRVASLGHQVAVLSPTTILADQHYATFKKRLAPFGLNVGLLSRFEKKSDQRRVLAGLNEGKIDVVIGTHRLFSSDVRFKNLSLLIIDEEQRFGVAAKEKLKKMKESVDVLSLSATPIPRTLYLSLSSFRKMSLIETPPPGRLNIETHIGPWDEGAIKQALEKELERKGQIFWLHNRIETLDKITRYLKKIIPGAKIESAHGRLEEKSLREIMQRFRDKKTDVLVTTTIIENGLDLPNVNTLIVDAAEKLGLGQAWQLRGRIGRSHNQAFAYFFHGKHLTETAHGRLEALREATKRLGGGFELAKRDLEIRGAGNILGREQSGAINQVGLNLYCQMLAEASEEIKSTNLTQLAT